ncbi:MAG: response regulator [Flavobacteriales bacterium]|nr:response regulator [Flavobacteriales bacterium]
MGPLKNQDITVLLVEDDEIDQMAFRRFVKQNALPYKYLVAGSVRDVKELVAKEQFDVAVVDYNLGDGTGMDVLEVIGSADPVIFVTGQGDQKLAVEAMKAGIFDYLIKDVNRDYLELLPVTIDNAISRRKAQQRIQEMEHEVQKLMWVVSQTENSMAIASKNGKIEWVNEGFERLTGYTANEVIGTHGDFLRKDHIAGLNPNSDQFTELQRFKRSVTAEIEKVRKDGTIIWALSTMTPILNKDGEIENIITIANDITDRKEAEQELLEAKQRAEHLAKTKEEFLANMSHEIRTPMNAIVGVAQLLRDTPLTESQSKYLNAIDFASDNLLNIINDVLDLSKLEANAVVYESRPFSIRNTVNQLSEMFRSKSEEKSVAFNTQIKANTPDTVLGDPTKINQILINLLSNAFKFTKKGEVKLTISSKEMADKEIELELAVSDTGIGIPEDKFQDVFASFQQAQTNTTRKYGGTGLGLTIVKKLAEGMGGNVDISSELGKGTTFTVNIPVTVLTDAPTGETKEKNTIETERLKGKRALLVEDNELNQMVADQFLTIVGIEVTTVNDGLLAVEAVSKDHFDLILMDIQMPNMDGYEAARQMRKNGLETPIIAMTAHAFSGEKEKCLAAGMNDYLTKPIKRDLLHSKIIEILTP